MAFTPQDSKDYLTTQLGVSTSLSPSIPMPPDGECKASAVEEYTAAVILIHKADVSQKNTGGENIPAADDGGSTNETLLPITFTSQLSWASQEVDMVRNDSFVLTLFSMFLNETVFIRESISVKGELMQRPCVSVKIASLVLNSTSLKNFTNRHRKFLNGIEST